MYFFLLIFILILIIVYIYVNFNSEKLNSKEISNIIQEPQQEKKEKLIEGTSEFPNWKIMIYDNYLRNDDIFK
jgi:hypothetical protein